MILLLAGSDRYRIEKRLNKIKNDNAENVTTFTGSFDIQKIIGQLQTLPFFTEKQKIILDGFLKSKDKDSQKTMKEFLARVPDFTELIFIETDLDERSALLKEIRKVGKVEIFGEIKGPELTNWIIDNIKSKGGDITRQVAEKLGIMVGSDLIRLENEINKLVAYNPQVSEESLNNLVDEGFFESIFSFMDSLSEKNPKKAIKLLDKFIDNENNELYLLSMLARQTRNLLQIKDLSKDNAELEIVKITKLHPFVVKKTISQARNFQSSDLLKLHRSILKADELLKSSSLDPKIILTRIIYDFTG